MNTPTSHAYFNTDSNATSRLCMSVTKVPKFVCYSLTNAVAKKYDLTDGSAYRNGEGNHIM